MPKSTYRGHQPNKKLIRLLKKEYKARHGFAIGTFARIARKTGVSRERVRQCAQKLALPAVYSEKNRRQMAIGLCGYCQEPMLGLRRQFCDQSCLLTALLLRRLPQMLERRCLQCQVLMLLEPYNATGNRGRFCSRRCTASYYTPTMGFLAHPENRIQELRKARQKHAILER